MLMTAQPATSCRTPTDAPSPPASPVHPPPLPPRRRLGVSREASFEEVQEARNFLVEQYTAHAASKESIELALDAILQVGVGPCVCRCLWLEGRVEGPRCLGDQLRARQHRQHACARPPCCVVLMHPSSFCRSG